jgi:hypothetical protein
MFKTFVLGFIVGIALLLVGGVAGFQASKDPVQAKQQQELELFKTEVVDATPVQLGVLTELQQKHSKLFSIYKELQPYRVSTLVADRKNKVTGIEMGIGLGPKLKKSETPEDYFGKLATESDAIIRGKATKKVSQVTQDDSFTFTDYDVTISEILKNNAASPLKTGAAISIIRPGGKVVIDDIIINCKDEHYLSIPLNQDIVIFLKYVPETGAYHTTKDNGSFHLDGEILRPLTGIQFPPGVLQNSQSFLQTIRAIQSK